MAAPKDDLEKRLAQLKKEVPTRGIERHPWVVKSVSDLPAELRSPAVTLAAADRAIQRIIVFPPQIHRGWHYVPKQALLFTPTDVIHLLASIWPDQKPQVTCLDGGGLLYLKATLLLLYGYLEIVAKGPDSPTRLGMEFNTVAWDYLSLPVRQLLGAAKVTAVKQTDKATYSTTARQAAKKLPLKFSNGLKIYGLLPGEELEELVFQPGTWKRWRMLFRRAMTADTLLLLTSNYVVIIQEELEIAQGWIISYIPQNSIVGMQNQLKGQWNELTFQLKRGEQTAEYKLQLKDEAVQDWHLRWLQHGGQWQG